MELARDRAYFTAQFDVLAEKIEGAPTSDRPLHVLLIAMGTFLESLYELQASADPIADIPTAERLAMAFEDVLPGMADRLRCTADEASMIIEASVRMARLYGQPLSSVAVVWKAGYLESWTNLAAILVSYLEIAFRTERLHARINDARPAGASLH